MQTQQNTIPPMFSLLHGDCLEKLATLRDNSIDAIVTDPPYGLGEAPDALAMLRDWLETGHHEVKSKRGFMGKTWDNFVPQPRVWHEVFRVLKPGGHVLAFAGTRTQDLMALGLRLAGFEIRDLVAWVYGSGFPKSLDVSKALDRMAGSVGENTLDLKREIRRRYEAAGMTLRQFNELCGFEASGYLRETGTWASVLPSAEKWAQMKSVLKCDGELDALFAAAEREIVGYQKRGNSLNTDFMSGGNDITIPATDAAKQWEGWGTALKPALEPITLARKPLEGTVAANMLKWHTGALNVDACRVNSGPVEVHVRTSNVTAASSMSGVSTGSTGSGEFKEGRWPANLIHDGSEEVVGLFPDTGKSTGGRTVKRSGGGNVGSGKASEASWTNDDPGYGDSGSAARFFQCCPPEALDLLFCRAKSIHGAWKLKNVSRAESSLPHQKQAVATVLNDAVIAASRGDKLLSDVKGLSTTVTGSEFEKLCETLITAMLISESVALPALSQDALIQNGCRVSVAAIQKPTDTMTIMISLPTFGGYAEPVTFSITPSSMALGVKDLSTNRFRYCAKVSPSERNAGLSDLPDKEWKADGAAIPQRADRPFKPSKNNHPTVKPLALMRYLCRLITPPSGTILDPYLGSGSTGVAALQEGFDFIGIEREEEYFTIATARIDNALKTHAP